MRVLLLLSKKSFSTLLVAILSDLDTVLQTALLTCFYRSNILYTEETPERSLGCFFKKTRHLIITLALSIDDRKWVSWVANDYGKHAMYEYCCVVMKTCQLLLTPQSLLKVVALIFDDDEGHKSLIQLNHCPIEYCNTGKKNLFCKSERSNFCCIHFLSY